MKKWLVAIVFLLLAGCGNNNAAQSSMPLELKVALEGPVKAELNKPYVYQAKVSYGKETVKDADVQFEITSNSGVDEMKPAKQSADGTYELSYSFRADSMYTIQSHVSAKDQHTMPKLEVMAGNGGIKERNRKKMETPK
ncbi:FixH family protein [Metabacillus sp. GX 13764]|uniref:FixH family protein n=1 Tax=Metabacillus kandeliae TaxID=2900151 RepID=UPI001E36EAEB|nr:FixH family protein [Metabacillus kandeliae]MCD7032622.1 FixH family protein [Metabacillus kandeliae]